MVERSLCMREARGSIPRISNTFLSFCHFNIIKGHGLANNKGSRTEIFGIGAPSSIAASPILFCHFNIIKGLRLANNKGSRTEIFGIGAPSSI
jgi:hypothetical protein